MKKTSGFDKLGMGLWVLVIAALCFGGGFATGVHETKSKIRNAFLEAFSGKKALTEVTEKEKTDFLSDLCPTQEPEAEAEAIEGTDDSEANREAGETPEDGGEPEDAASESSNVSNDQESY